MTGEDDLNDLSKVFAEKTTLAKEKTDREAFFKEEAYEFF